MRLTVNFPLTGRIAFCQAVAPLVVRLPGVLSRLSECMPRNIRFLLMLSNKNLTKSIRIKGIKKYQCFVGVTPYLLCRQFFNSRQDFFETGRSGARFETRVAAFRHDGFAVAHQNDPFFAHAD